jgi:ABC-2 type transport system ATP-binding protein
MNRKLLRELIDEQHQAGRTLIFSTHAMYEAEQLCDHLVMINRGQKVLDIGMEALWRKYDPKTVIVEPLEGVEGMEFELGGLPGVAHSHRTETGVELKLEEGADPAALMAAAAGRVRARRVELKRASVEDIFIAIVEKSGGSGEEIENLRMSVQAEREKAGVARG